jgi:23S rRNA pseudouridine2605 synthase
MPSPNNPRGRRRRISDSSSNSEQGKKSVPNRRSDSSSRPWKSDSKTPRKGGARPGPRSKFGSSNEDRRGSQGPPSDRRSNFKDEKSGNSKNYDSKKRSSRYPREEKPAFKARGGDPPSTGLRRERPYKTSEESGNSFAGSTFSKRTGKSRKASDDKIQPDLKAPAQTEKIRLNRFIANSGVCSRREADELIKMGLISVNGKVITEMGYKVNPGDEVRHESKVLRAERPVYILLNKPKGFLTTTNDPQERNTVMHLIGNKVKERVYPVGRLDRNTTGLLLLTNDGEVADKLMHPSYNVKKIYKVELDKPLTKADAQLILDGVQLDEGKAIVDDLAIISDDKRTVGLEIHIGWNRVVRRIFETLNYEVLKLDRSVYAGLDKKNLGRGEWRFLSKEELVRLKHF